MPSHTSPQNTTKYEANSWLTPTMSSPNKTLEKVKKNRYVGIPDKRRFMKVSSHLPAVTNTRHDGHIVSPYPKSSSQTRTYEYRDTTEETYHVYHASAFTDITKYTGTRSSR